MKLRIPWTWLVVGAGTLFFGINITRSVLAQSPSLAREADVAKSVGRTVKPVAGVDERSIVPDGDYVGGNGVIEPADRETRVAAQVSGRIARLVVKEGDRVEAGALLVSLEDATETATLAASEGDLKAAEAEYQRAARGNRVEDIDAAKADAAAAAERAGLSDAVAQRLVQAAKGGGATPDEVDRALRQAKVDRANLALAEARRRSAVAGSRREDVLAAKARVTASQARRDQAKAALELRSVRAPIAGEILSAKFRAGEYYQAGGAEPLLIMGDTSKLRARLDIDERDVGRVERGAKAKVRLPSSPGRDYTGTVVELGRRMGRKNVRSDDPVERNDTKILEVVVELDPADTLVVGQRVMGYVTTKPAAQ